jgi:hypothetical protein
MRLADSLSADGRQDAGDGTGSSSITVIDIN